MSLGFSTFPNTIYICSKCDRNLGSKIDRLNFRKVPNANHIDGKCYCDKCSYVVMEEKQGRTSQ